MKPYRLFLVSGLLLLASLPAHAIVDVNDNGLSDLWEKAHNNGNLFPGNFDPQADPDGDGWTNAQEAAAGTDPSDANPPTGYLQPEITFYPAVYSTDPETTQTPAMVTLNWLTLPGKQYTLHYSTDLAPGNWSPLGAPRIGTGWDMGNGITLTQPDGSIADRIFWRVAVTDPVPAVDTDSDGLGDYEEYLAGTDPVITDSDGDTLSDNAELIAGTNPNHADEDGDGITDPLEITAGTDSKNQDTDGDAIPDWLDPQPLLSAQVFADADDDGIPDANDPDPNNPRGPKPLIISENASGNPNCELEMDESSSFILTVSNPAGPAPTSSDFILYLNGNEETANITALTSTPSSTGTQRFNFNWLAKVTTSYPAQTLQNISLRFRDSQNATTWLNVARADVAEWEGMIAALPYGPPSGYWAIRADSHYNGVKFTSVRHLGASNAGYSVWYRGPKNVSLLDYATGTPRLTAQIPESCRYPLFFISGTAPTALAVTQTLDISNPDTYNHNGVFYINNHSTDIRMTLDPGGTMTTPPGQLRYQPMAEAPETGPPLTHVQGFYQKDGEEKLLTSMNWPLYPASGGSRMYSAVNFFTTTTPAGDDRLTFAGADLWADVWARIIPHTAGSLEQPGIAISTADITNVTYDGSRVPLLPIQSGQWHKLVLKVGPDAGAVSNGITLKLGTGEEGENAPQSGFSLQVKNSNGFTPLPIPGNGEIEMLPSSELYQKLTSLEGLTLFLKRDSTVNEFHRLGLDLIPKRSTYLVQRVAALDALPVDIVNNAKNPVSELVVADMEESPTSGGELILDEGVSAGFTGDPDRFYVRIPDMAGNHTVTVKLSTFENPDASYNDDPTELRLYPVDGGYESKSQVLVSGAIDAEITTLENITPDNPDPSSRHKRTHNVQLGGKVRISDLVIDGKAVTADLKIPVPVKKTVKLNFVVINDAATPDITAELKAANEMYASTGIKLEKAGEPVTKPPLPGLPGQSAASELNIDDISDVGRYLSHYGTANSVEDIHVFYVKQVFQFDENNQHVSSQGYSIIEKSPGTMSGEPTPSAKDTGDANNVFIGDARASFVTLAHEVGHVLTNDYHYGTNYASGVSNRQESHNLMSGTTRNRFETDNTSAKKRIYEMQRQLIFNHWFTP